MVTPALRIVFFGTPQFAVPTLEALVRSRHQVVAVVTQPDKARGRGQRVSDSPAKAFAAAERLAILQPVRLREPSFLADFKALAPDLGVVAAYGRILPDDLLALPRLGMINVHASLLPKYRGAAPVHRAILAGESKTGVTIMRVVRQLDAGPMLAAVECRIAPDATSVELEADLARTGAALLVETVERMASGPIQEMLQDEASATYAPRLTREDGLIVWSESAQQVHDRVRGLYPWPHAYTFLDGRRFIVLRTRAETATADHAPPGTVTVAAGDDLIVAAGTGRVRIGEIQPEGRRPMTPREFLAGRAVPVGARFATA
jgi:methionyl-tRNA formyltransferase